MGTNNGVVTSTIGLCTSCFRPDEKATDYCPNCGEENLVVNGRLYGWDRGLRNNQFICTVCESDENPETQSFGSISVAQYCEDNKEEIQGGTSYFSGNAEVDTLYEGFDTLDSHLECDNGESEIIDRFALQVDQAVCENCFSPYPLGIDILITKTRYCHDCGNESDTNLDSCEYCGASFNGGG